MPKSRDIDAQFKLDSVLLFKLLRFINSPMNGLSRKVMTIEESLMLLGRESLFKWLTMLLFTSRKSEDGRSLALLERSLFRARFMEALGQKGGNHKLECEHLFLTGMFSLLDSLMQVELNDALAPLELPPTVIDALLNQHGLFAPYLALAISAEQDNHERMTTLARDAQAGRRRCKPYPPGRHGLGAGNPGAKRRLSLPRQPVTANTAMCGVFSYWPQAAALLGIFERPRQFFNLLFSMAMFVYCRYQQSSKESVMSKAFQSRQVERLVQGSDTSDGAGVKLKRVLTQDLQRRLDPFLMLDEFRSDNPGDYIAGFPPHPHRGFENRYLYAGWPYASP